MKLARTLTIAAAGTAIAAVLGLWTAQALATSPSGVERSDLAAGTIADHFSINASRNHPSAVAFQKLTINPGGTSGWHSHDADVIVMVAAGTLTLTDHDCSVRVLSANQGFTETPGHIHEARNLGQVPVVVYVAYITYPGAMLRVDEADPGCGAS